MSGEDEQNVSRWPDGIGIRVRNAVFGDRLGLVVFLGTVCFAMVYWRAGVFITDNETLVRTLDGVSNGHLWIESVGEEQPFDAPGAEVRDGFVYGRNYGQLVVSLPFLWILEILDVFVDMRAGLIALWHLLALGLAVQLGHLFERRADFALGGSILVLSSFIVNLLFATQLSEPSLELFALQLAALTATGFIGVVLYRVVAFKHHRRLGALVGAASVVVLPIGFWASIPKRHIFTTLVCVLVLYLFARSRTGQSIANLPYLGSVPLFRAAMYVFVGFLTWIHAAEGLFVFLTVFAVDIPTAPTNDRRTLAVVGGLFLLSLLPTLLTNVLVTGELFRPPRTLGGTGFTTPAAVEEIGEGAESTQSISDTGTASDTGGDNGSVLEGVIGAIVSTPFWWFFSEIAGIVTDSVTVLTNTDRMVRVFLQSRTAEIGSGNIQFRAVNLSVLESLPLLGSGVAIVAAAVSRHLHSIFSGQTGWDAPRLHRIDSTGVLAGSLILAFVLLYLSKLPLHVQITQRYVLPIYPLALYLLTTSEILRDIVNDERRLLSWSYCAGTLLGTQLFVTYVVQRNLAVAEAARVNATLALVTATAVSIAVFSSAVAGRFKQVAAITLGLACASGTLFILVSGIHYFSATGQYVLPIVQFVSDLLAPFR